MSKKTVKENERKERKQTANLLESLPDDAVIHARFADGDQIDASILRTADLKFFAANYLSRTHGAPVGNRNAVGNKGGRPKNDSRR